MIDKNIPRSAFSHKSWAGGFRPRAGDYLSWPCKEFDDNRCYQPNKVIGFDGGRIITDKSGTTGYVDEWHIGYFIWYRPSTKLTIVIKL